MRQSADRTYVDNVFSCRRADDIHAAGAAGVSGAIGAVAIVSRSAGDAQAHRNHRDHRYRSHRRRGIDDHRRDAGGAACLGGRSGHLADAGADRRRGVVPGRCVGRERPRVIRAIGRGRGRVRDAGAHVESGIHRSHRRRLLVHRRGRIGDDRGRTAQLFVAERFETHDIRRIVSAGVLGVLRHP